MKVDSLLWLVVVVCICASSWCVDGGDIVDVNAHVVLQLKNSNTVRVVKSRHVQARKALEDIHSLTVVQYQELTERRRLGVWIVETDEEQVVLENEAFKVVGWRHSGLLEFFHKTANGSTWTATRELAWGTQDNQVFQDWELEDAEALFGGGQQVFGQINYRAAPVRLIQQNTQAAVPFFISTRQYGILWDLYGETMLNEPQFTVTLGANKTGTFVAPEDGIFWFFIRICDGFWCGSDPIKLLVVAADDGEPAEVVVCEHSLKNIPDALSCRADGMVFVRGQSYHIQVLGSFNVQEVKFNAISSYSKTRLGSKDTDVIDYYFVFGDINANTLDAPIAGYRSLTGSAPLAPKWAFGFWQCKQRYHSQEELLAAAEKFRQLDIPVDNIVQDWMYWGSLGWGPQWDPTIFPDPKGMVAQLKSLNFHFMVSTWPKFDEKTRFFQEMNQSGFLIPGSTFFDAWNPTARDLFFNYTQQAHFSIGVDALWLDATEPENADQVGKKIFLGNGSSFRNTYSLMVAQSVASGLEKERNDQRVFSLTRSSFAGQQRFGAVLWSGDVSGTWNSLGRQIAMSLNYQLSGIPYWSMDIGGFFRPHDQYESDDYNDLLIRWFQFGAFVPIMRVHGDQSNTELWNYGEETLEIILRSAINLRYRLLDYIYSGFRRVETEHYTMQRALVLDFPDQPDVYPIADQFLFGESVLVAPIYNPEGNRVVFLPQLRKPGAVWWNFYTGEKEEVGWHRLEDFPIDEIPLYVQSSLLVLGPPRQHVFDRLVDENFEVRVYRGADCVFHLYEDDGVSNDPSRRFTLIRITWNDRLGLLSFGERTGSPFPSMVRTKTFEVVLVRPGIGVGPQRTTRPDIAVPYDGSPFSLQLPLQDIIVASA